MRRFILIGLLVFGLFVAGGASFLADAPGITIQADGTGGNYGTGGG